MLNKFFIFFCFLCVVNGCAANPNINPSLGYGDSRRIVIVGEKVSPTIAYYYQRTYDAPVWFTPAQSKVGDSGNRLLESLGPTRGMKVLIGELKSINYTIGEWEIIIPKIAEHYFEATLSNMAPGALSRARGVIVLIDSAGNKDIEAQVQRVTEGNFFVTYELHKGLKK